MSRQEILCDYIGTLRSECILDHRWLRSIINSVLLLVLGGDFAAQAGDLPSVDGDATIQAKAGTSEIVITTTSRLAGAIHSLTWGGREFIDSWDHGRQMQTAWNANAGVDPIQSETFNPTEAGSRDDDRGTRSSSRLMSIRAKGNVLESLSQPAFWLAPGEASDGNPARNKTVLSNHKLRKRVVIGYKNLSHAIDYHVTITIPGEEHNTHCVVEALTGYMPPYFERFWTFNEATSQLERLSGGPGEQNRPVMFSTADGACAMGVFSPKSDAQKGERGPSYGRWKFEAARVVKWNCVYRLHDSEGLAGDYPFHVFVAVGTLEDVRGTIAALVAKFEK